MSLHIALQLYSVRNEAKTNLEETIKKIKEMGYDGIEFAGLSDLIEICGIEKIKEICDREKISCISAHIPYEALINNLDETISNCKYLGCEYVAIPYLTPENRPGTDGFTKVIENAEKIGEAAKKYNITLLYHNNDFEFTKINNKYALDILYDTISPDLLQTEIDTCWVKVADVDPVEYLNKYSGRAPVVHLKDYYGEKSENMYELIGLERKAPVRPSNFEFRPLGYGLQDMKAVVESVKSIGAKWIIVEQDEPSMGLSPIECAAKSREYLKSIGM